MNADQRNEAARFLLNAWTTGVRVGQLPEHCRARERVDGYQIQEALARLANDSTYGWKIAATSTAGQRHINVSGPLAGRLLARRVLALGVPVPIAANSMRVAEAEFAFRMAADLPPRGRDYTTEETLAAVASLHPAIEIPDSRYIDFTLAGDAQLIADNACACYFTLGPASRAEWRDIDLARHQVSAYLNGSFSRDGHGANVLGDPRIALTWVANELNRFGYGLKAGEVITTGTCVAPVPVSPGDLIRADFGAIGEIAVSLTE